MRRIRLPVLFVVMALGLALFVVKYPEKRGAQAATVVRMTQPVQSVEQQRAAVIYFRIMSWLSAIVPKADAKTGITR
jgi:hypothetical protein